MSRSKGYGFQTKFSTEARTTNSAAFRGMASTLRMRRGFQLEVLKAPAEHLSPSFPWVCPPHGM